MAPPVNPCQPRETSLQLSQTGESNSLASGWDDRQSRATRAISTKATSNTTALTVPPMRR